MFLQRLIDVDGGGNVETDKGYRYFVASWRAGVVIVSQRADRTPPALSASNQIAPQTNGIAPASSEGITR
jgi:hypothetical protein